MTLSSVSIFDIPILSLQEKKANVTLDNEHKATARKQRRHEEYSQGLVDIKCAISATEACIQRQAQESRGLQGLWHIQDKRVIPPGFE